MAVLVEQRLGGRGVPGAVLVTPGAIRRDKAPSAAALVGIFDDRLRHGVAVRFEECLRELVAHLRHHRQHVGLIPVCGRHTCDARRVLAADLRRDVIQRHEVAQRVAVLRRQLVHHALDVDPHINLGRPTCPALALLVLHPVDHMLISGVVPIAAEQRVEAVILIRLVADRRNLAACQDEEHRLLAGLFGEEITLPDKSFPQRHETDLQAVRQLIGQYAEVLHHVRGVVDKIVVNLLEHQIACPTGRIDSNTGIWLNIERGHENTPSSHRWNLPAQVSATAQPAPTTQKGGLSSNPAGIGGWFGGTACKVVPAYLPAGAGRWVSLASYTPRGAVVQERQTVSMNRYK